MFSLKLSFCKKKKKNLIKLLNSAKDKSSSSSPRGHHIVMPLVIAVYCLSHALDKLGHIGWIWKFVLPVLVNQGPTNNQVKFKLDGLGPVDNRHVTRDMLLGANILLKCQLPSSYM